MAAPAYALHDAALTALYCMLGAFGSSLLSLVTRTQAQLPYGSMSDVSVLLSKCMAHSE